MFVFVIQFGGQLLKYLLFNINLSNYMEVNKMRKNNIIPGLIIYSIGALAGQLLLPDFAKVNELEEKAQSSPEAHIKAIQRHEDFLSQLSNYDGFSAWLGGNYEDWMIQDINEHYCRD